MDHISLKDLAYPTDEDTLKIILSSADMFPGLYRMTSGWQHSLHKDGFLKLMTFLEAQHRSLKGEQWTKAQWFSIHEQVYELGYGAKSRNEQRTDNALKQLLRQRGREWFDEPRSFSLALIDNETPVNSIKMDKTYYMMGSLLHFKANECLVSYDDLTKKSALSLKVPFTVASKYIDQVFSPETIEDLFYQAAIVAHLDFDTDDIGTLSTDNELTSELLSRFPGNCPILAAVNYSEILPIRFAKLIGVTNVCR